MNKIRIRVVCPKCNQELGEIEGNEEAGQLLWMRNCKHYAWMFTYDEEVVKQYKDKSIATIKEKTFFEGVCYFMCLPIEVKEDEG
jgi:uncharacterized protein YbaR (Trm112 family)